MPRHRRVLTTCVAAALACLLGVAVPDEECLRIALAESKAVAHAATSVRKSVVALRALGTGRDAYGTGIIVTAEGLVLTALHVVDGATAISVTLDEGEDFTGRIRAWDRSVDVALLEVVAPPGRTFTPAPLASDQALEVGETVVAVSNPFGLGTSVSKGVLSAVGRRNVVEGQQAPLLQTDAAINPGSSGGALVSLRGEVIGLITAIITRTGGHQGVGLAVPAHDLRLALERLSSGEAPPRAWLGVRVHRDPVPGKGLKILEVAPEGPAAAAGIRGGDILKSLEGRPLERLEDLRQALDEAKAGDSLSAELARKGESLSLMIHVGAKD